MNIMNAEVFGSTRYYDFYKNPSRPSWIKLLTAPTKIMLKMLMLEDNAEDNAEDNFARNLDLMQLIVGT